MGGILCGHTCVCAVELEPYRRKILLQRQRDGILPRFPIWDDVTTFDGKPWRGRVDIVCGGFPCQDISVGAGPRAAGIKGKRSGLWGHMARIIDEIRPNHVWIENSQVLVSRGLGLVLSDIFRLGYDAKWGVVSARNAAGPHLRERIWIYASNAHKVRQFKGIKQSRFLATEIGPGTQWNGRVARSGGHALENWGWTYNATFERVDDGMGRRMDRVEAAGDGQVPAVVKLAWDTLTGEL